MKEEIKKIEELQNRINELCNERNAIEQKAIEEIQYPRIKALIGVCLKTNYNSRYYYNCYKKILDCIENKKEKTLYLIFEEFYINKEGVAHFSIGSETPYTNKEWWDEDLPIYGYSKIGEKEYQREKMKMFDEMFSQKMLKKFLLSRR
jgi:hypothetical protein